MPVQRFLFTAALTCASRAVQLRDRMLSRIPRGRPESAGIAATQHTIASGKNLIDAAFVTPAPAEAQAAVLICHGIGEIVPQWFPIQRIFAENGIASLVFDYSGYGRSTGRPDWSQCEDDAVSAFNLLKLLAPRVPVAILGFSLGTGIAPAILNRVEADRLVLCAGFSSFRKAARAAWVPGFLSPFVPPIWSAEEALRDCSLPILIVQGDRDRLFRLPMAQELVACCNGRADLLVLPARSHNEPFYNPQPHYWGPIVSWLLRDVPPLSPSQANSRTR
ncbi:MAG TPA: alpha/beta fold hydrolase [Terracidiphilus sp.]|nr:alpha/beta fold hydrolase [Terracidiphilus sp.]